ncbi:hypothetical protein MM221_19925 [Salipaludibacillus sp. LMS25]|jgi:phage FluMu gp28-like protein|uniref:hypothetical protein n=1 Tax=Salipaludibacillus sp. LMS25 TaxID=2924031 RepID=UPI0020D01CE7|nr:hypothetical protein [Salipaludibacillus sp. LMS25]UTR14786.1 hypothetical protein MM221_19925 [Salipaludibacillus sp. LMS25]
MINKKFIYIFLAVGMFLGIWVIFSINQPPKWIGTSQEGQWRADYNREANAPKGDWIGYLYWDGKEDVTIVGAELTKNGELVHQLENHGDKLTEEDNYLNYIHSWESMFKNKNDNLQLKVYWEDKEGKHEDTIVMSPKNRYFVLPTILN